MYLSSVIRRGGHETRLLIEDAKPLNNAIADFDPDVIAFSVTTGTHRWALARATALRESSRALMVMGGPHATYYPEVVESPALDMIFRGESEYAFLQFLNRLDAGESFADTPNAWVKEDGKIHRNPLSVLIDPLDDLPVPDRMLYYAPYPWFRKNENKPFISGRGCPFSCTYCSIAGLRELYRGKGRFVRFHSPERVVEEIAEVRDRFGLRTVIFQDDTFIIGPERLEKLLRLYEKKVRLPFVCHIRADLLTRDMARQLKSAGCHSVDFGVESGDETLRAAVLGKPISDATLKDAAGYLRDAGIPFRTTNMFGLPGETLTQAWKTVTLNQTLGTRYPSSSIYQPYPRTALGDRVIESGLAGREYSIDSIGSTFFRTSLLNRKNRNQFINLQKLFWPAVRFPFLMPVIRTIIKLPPNPLYECVFLFCYAMNYARSERVSVKHVVNIGRRTARTVFFGKM